MSYIIQDPADMERILFLIPPHISFNQFKTPAFNERLIEKSYGTFGSVLTEMPLGVFSMSAYLKKHIEVETKMIDFNVHLNKIESFNFTSFEDYFHHALSLKKYRDYRPTIVAISTLFTPAYKNSLDMARCCRSVFPESIIISGGSVPTNLYKQIYKESDDNHALCNGEGEKPLLELVKAPNKIMHLEENHCWITKRKVAAQQNFQMDLVEDLDEIPFLYDDDICDHDDYGLNPAITANPAIENKKQNFHVMTSRGCPFKCCFCASHKVHGREMRYYSLERVKSDFLRLKEKLKAKTIVFQDDHLMGNKKRALTIVRMIEELKLNAVFQNSLALYALDREMLIALKNAGLDQLVLSVESGSDRVLKEIMHKPLKLSIIERVANDCRALGIYTLVNILIGLPGETKSDIEDATNFLKTINANWYLIYCANPLVGSEMFDICEEKNYFKSDYLDCDYKKAIVETEDFTAQYIQETAYLLNLELNFIDNSDMHLGHYRMALKGFENAIKAKSDHAIAYHYASICYQKLGDFEKAKQYMEKKEEILSTSDFWRQYARQFDIHNVNQQSDQAAIS